MAMKAQAAMEYLMTYGWAILIVIIVAAALYALGVFNPATWTGTRTTGFPNIGVPQDWQYTGTSGQLQVILRNGLGKAIDVSAVTATCNTSAGPYGVQLYSAGVGSLGAGVTRAYYTNATVAAEQCDAISSGSSFSVQLKVEYTPQGDSYSKTDTRTITGISA
jgi:hypothetical protein